MLQKILKILTKSLHFFEMIYSVLEIFSFIFRYLLVWSKKKTYISLWIVFIFSILLTIIYSSSCHTYKQVRYYNSVFLWPIVEIIVMLYSIPVYIYILRKMSKNRKVDKSVKLQLSNSSSSGLSKEAGGDNTKRMQNRYSTRMFKGIVHLPFLLVTTFLTFWLIPDQIIFFTKLFDVKISTEVWFVMGLSFAVGFITDPVLYVLLSKEFRKVIRRFFRRNKY